RGTRFRCSRRSPVRRGGRAAGFVPAAGQSGPVLSDVLGLPPAGEVDEDKRVDHPDRWDAEDDGDRGRRSAEHASTTSPRCRNADWMSELWLLELSIQRSVSLLATLSDLSRRAGREADVGWFRRGGRRAGLRPVRVAARLPRRGGG